MARRCSNEQAAEGIARLYAAEGATHPAVVKLLVPSPFSVFDWPSTDTQWWAVRDTKDLDHVKGLIESLRVIRHDRS
jgi:hypothetical protein